MSWQRRCPFASSFVNICFPSPDCFWAQFSVSVTVSGWTLVGSLLGSLVSFTWSLDDFSRKLAFVVLIRQTLSYWNFRSQFMCGKCKRDIRGNKYESNGSLSDIMIARNSPGCFSLSNRNLGRLLPAPFVKSCAHFNP